MSWHVQQNLDVSHLRSNLPVVKNPNSENTNNHPTIPGNKKNLQASSLGQTKKCPWWNVQESHLSPQRPQPATDPREPGGARLRSNAKWQERGCICKITSLVFIEFGWQHYPVGDFRSHAVPCWYSESWKFFRFDELFWECDKGWLYYTFMRFCRGWAHGQEVWETKASTYTIYRQKTLQWSSIIA